MSDNFRRAAGLTTMSFLRLWLRRPHIIGAIAPSGRSLAAAMAREVDFERPGTIVELGGGTGSITKTLVAKTASQGDIVVVEREAKLYAILAERFPGIRIIHGDARNLGPLLAAAGIGRVKAVVSGLPLLCLSARSRARILCHVFAVLEPDGVFVQFTYGWTKPIAPALVKRSGTVGRRTRWIVNNLPPAAVWRYSEADAAVPAITR
ncbi:MAG: class I SAM-dependent methyltransferase [Rhodospirillales bacterium]